MDVELPESTSAFIILLPILISTKFSLIKGLFTTTVARRLPLYLAGLRPS